MGANGSTGASGAGKGLRDVPMRVVLALGASAVLTAGVALPMAYQAREARQQNALERQQAEVLGTDLQRPSLPTDGSSDDLYWAPAGETERRELADATVSGGVLLFLDADDVVRVDFRLADGEVETDRSAPWEVRDGEAIDTASMDPGATSLTATVSFSDGRTELRVAEFEIADS